MNTDTLYNQILEDLQSMANPQFKAGMARFGIDSARALGIKTPLLRAYAKAYGRNHELALMLWKRRVERIA